MPRERRFAFVSLQVALAMALATGCSKRSGGQSTSNEAASPTPAPLLTSEPASPDVISAGADVYELSCAMCHYDGSGSPAAPPLKGSPVVAESAEAVILTILKGRQGQAIVDGKPFNGLMPAQATLSDEEIAAVVAFVRKQFGGVDSAVKPSEVAALR